MITFEQVKKQDPDGAVAVDGLNLDVPDGKTMILVGPNDCGKTTSLRTISRLVEPTKGRIDLNVRDVRQQHPPSCGGRSATLSSGPGSFPLSTAVTSICPPIAIA